MSRRSRRWVCCLAAVVLTALSGWRVAETGASVVLDVPAVAGVTTEVAQDATSLHSRRVVTEPASAKRVELERLLAVTVVVAVVVLAALRAGPGRTAHDIRSPGDRSLLRSRGPPVSFVS